jgi:hypothetical protein
MNTQSLNRSIGLAMSALQQARNYQHGATNQTMMFLVRAVRHLNKARACLRRGWIDEAKGYAGLAHIEITSAIASR